LKYGVSIKDEIINANICVKKIKGNRKRTNYNFIKKEGGIENALNILDTLSPSEPSERNKKN
jgi:hypothetical protein